MYAISLPAIDLSVDCNFEQVSKCGYQNTSIREVEGMSTWIRYSGQMRNGHLNRDHTTDTETGQSTQIGYSIMYCHGISNDRVRE